MIVAGLLLAGAAVAEDRVEVEVTGDRITAGDLANHIGSWAGVEPSVELGYAPLPGVERRVTRGQVVEWGKNVGLVLDPQVLPGSLIVSRKMRRLTADEALGAVRRAVAEDFKVSADRVQVKLTGFDEPLVPAGELRIAMAGSLARLSQEGTLPLRWTDDDGRSGVVRFRALVAITGSYAVARAAILRGTELSPGDFEFRSGALPGDPDEYLLGAEHVEGKTIGQSLKPGEVLQRRMLRATPDIERGELATIEARFGSVLLRVPGRADAAGSEGDVIPCRNLESGRRITCRVVSSTQLEAVLTP